MVGALLPYHAQHLQPDSYIICQPLTQRTLVQVPVGRETLGRIMNVIGEPVDEQGPISKYKYSWASAYQ